MRILNITILSNLALKYLNLRAPQICCLLIRNYVAAILSLLSVSLVYTEFAFNRPIGCHRHFTRLESVRRKPVLNIYRQATLPFPHPVYSFFQLHPSPGRFLGKARGHPRNTDLPLVDKLHRRLIGHN